MESRLASELANFNGNYLNHLENEDLPETFITQQLQRLLDMNCYQLGYIFCPSVSGEEGRLIASQLKPSQLKSASSNLFFSNPFEITSLQLICRNLTPAFDGLFHDLWVIKVKELQALKKTLANTSAIVIFSNDPTEVEKVCTKIKALFDPRPTCFFILANSKTMDLDMNTNILAQIGTHTIETDMDSFNFWKQARDLISNLAEIASKKQSMQKRCIMM